MPKWCVKRISLAGQGHGTPCPYGVHEATCKLLGANAWPVRSVGAIHETPEAQSAAGDRLKPDHLLEGEGNTYAAPAFVFVAMIRRGGLTVVRGTSGSVQSVQEVAHHGVEGIRLLLVAPVTALWKHDQPGAGDSPMHHL